MHNVIDVIRERRSIHSFKKEEVPMELLVELLDAAVWAPNRRQREPWRFIAVQGEARKKLAAAAIDSMTEAYREKQAAKLMKTVTEDVPLTLVVVCPVNDSRLITDEDYAAACCAVQNLQLAAWERGLGMIWKTNDYMYETPFHAFLGIKADERVVAMLQIGYPDMVPKPAPRTPAADKLTVIES